VTGKRGFTLLEMIVATTLMGIAVVGLLAGISGATRNAARLRDYDRVVQLARLRMNDLLTDPRHGVALQGTFPPALAGGLDSGWRAQVTTAEMSPNPVAGEFALDRIELEIWWVRGDNRRTFALEGYRRRIMRPEDLAAGVSR
jgi:general secretion pathway protein I